MIGYTAPTDCHPTGPFSQENATGLQRFLTSSSTNIICSYNFTIHRKTKCEIFFENHMPTPLEKGHKSLGWMNSELKANLEIAELDAARGALHMQQFYAESYSHREDLTFV